MPRLGRRAWDHAIIGGEPGLSESRSYQDHQSALGATLFGAGSAREEFVFELQAGELRLRMQGGD